MAVFITVLCFNLFWLYKYGKAEYVEMFNGSHAWWFSALCWTYNAWGVVNLIFWT